MVLLERESTSPALVSFLSTQFQSSIHYTSLPWQDAAAPSCIRCALGSGAESEQLLVTLRECCQHGRRAFRSVTNAIVYSVGRLKTRDFSQRSYIPKM